MWNQFCSFSKHYNQQWHFHKKNSIQVKAKKVKAVGVCILAFIQHETALFLIFSQDFTEINLWHREYIQQHAIDSENFL